MICGSCGCQISNAVCPECGIYNNLSSDQQPIKKKANPTPLKKIINFSSSLTRHAKNGFAGAEESIKEQRMKICMDCEHFNKSGSTCNQCGCFLGLKTSWASESCPIGKWGQQESPKNIPKTCGGCNKKSQK